MSKDEERFNEIERHILRIYEILAESGIIIPTKEVTENGEESDSKGKPRTRDFKE